MCVHPERTTRTVTALARWVTLDELDALPLRGEEVREVFTYVARGAPVYPPGALTHEGAPWR